MPDKTEGLRCHANLTPVGKGGGWWDVDCADHRWRKRVHGFTAARSEALHHEAERGPFPPPSLTIAEALCDPDAVLTPEQREARDADLRRLSEARRAGPSTTGRVL